MTQVNQGASFASEVLSANLSFFTVITLIDITQTGIHTDDSQNNFETLINGISLRCQPVVFNNPVKTAVADVTLDYTFGADFTGAQDVWVWKFCTEHPQALSVAMLETELDQFPIIDVASNFAVDVMTTSGTAKNIYFIENDLL